MELADGCTVGGCPNAALLHIKTHAPLRAPFLLQFGLSSLSGSILGLPVCISPYLSNSHRRIGGI